MPVIPKVSASLIEAALGKFDRDFREDFDANGWEKNKAQKHVLIHGGRRYPPKKIVSIATGRDVDEFSGGPQTNSYLENLGFKVIPLEREASLLPNFKVGALYERWPDINDLYGGSRQSGISASSKTPAIFIFTGESGAQYGYQDDFDENGVFLYTGEGQNGDMTLTKGNRAIVDHSKDGRALHVFLTVRKPKGQRYLGEFTYASHEIKDGKDKSGALRKVIVFHLVPVSSIDEDLNDDAPSDLPVSPSGLEQARQRALAAFLPTVEAGTVGALRTLYRRSKAVKDYVILRSEGLCESCKKPAPFKRADGSAYLEPHHTTRVSDGGLDHPRYVAAICPTCHREIHHGADGQRRNLQLVEYLKSVEPERDNSGAL